MPCCWQVSGDCRWGRFGCRGQGPAGICLNPTKILLLGSLPLPSLALLLLIPPTLPQLHGEPHKGLCLFGPLPSGGPLLTIPTAQLLGFCPDLPTPNTVVHLMVPPLPPKLSMAPRCPQFRAQILVPEPILSLALPTSFFNGILRLLLTCQVLLSAFVFGEDSTSHTHLPGNLPCFFWAVTPLVSRLAFSPTSLSVSTTLGTPQPGAGQRTPKVSRSVSRMNTN